MAKLNTWASGLHLTEYNTDLPDGAECGFDVDFGPVCAYKGKVISVKDLPEGVKLIKMTKHRTLATKIFEHLVSKGAELGNVSIVLIESVLDKELKADPTPNLYEYGFEGGVMIVQAADIDQAREHILNKLAENEIEADDIPDSKIIDVTPKEPGVVAYFDM